MSRRFPWLLTVVVAAAVAVLLGLGVWQTQRLGWKQDLLTRIETARAVPPVPLNDALAAAIAGEPVEFRRVAFQCLEVGASQTIRLATTGESRSGEAALGHRYIYACPVVAGPWRSVLVDAGFDDIDVVSTCIVERDAPLPTLVGALRKDGGRNRFTPPDRPGDRLFYARDIRAMAASVGAERPAPYMVVLEQSQCWAQGRPTPLPTSIANNHLGYALTWFGLALALTGFYIAMLRQKPPPTGKKEAS